MCHLVKTYMPFRFLRCGMACNGQRRGFIMNLWIGEGRCALPFRRICWMFHNLSSLAGVAAGPYTEIISMLCRHNTSDPSTRFGIRYVGRTRSSACMQSFSKSSDILVIPDIDDVRIGLKISAYGRAAVPSRSDGFIGCSIICHRGPAWQLAPTRNFSRNYCHSYTPDVDRLYDGHEIAFDITLKPIPKIQRLSIPHSL